VQPYKNVTGKALPLERANVDTDQIIPAKYLKRIERTGFGEFLFDSWRKLDDGALNPDFILNDPRYEGSTIIITGPNFGSGSSREHAPWALEDYGFRTLIGSSFADIFKNNCFQNGMLPIELTDEAVGHFMERSKDDPDYEISVDLERCLVTGSDEYTAEFEIDSFRRDCLLRGLDEIGLTLEYQDAISQYEASHPIT
tara:strand:- start:1430 stop:2023 length:594 start_codon:yes stop_codon:yes gene_type:complete